MTSGKKLPIGLTSPRIIYPTSIYNSSGFQTYRQLLVSTTYMNNAKGNWVRLTSVVTFAARSPTEASMLSPVILFFFFFSLFLEWNL